MPTAVVSADWRLLQRERKTDVPGWLWRGACLTVLALALMLIGALAWGVAHLAARGAQPPPTRAPAPRHRRAAPPPMARVKG